MTIMFDQFRSYLTEDQIERKVERQIDRLDRVFMNSAMTQAEYDAEMRQINDWADAQYQYLAACKRSQ